MEAVLSNTTLTSSRPFPPVRSLASGASKLHSRLSCFTHSPEKILRCRRNPPLGFRNSHHLRAAITCGVAEISQEQFSEVVLRSERPVLVEFVANWCGPCRLISKTIEWAAEEYKEKITVVKIDHDANPTLIEEFKVYGLPTLILFKDGQMVPGSKREGAITKVKLQAYIDDLLEAVSVS